MSGNRITLQLQNVPLFGRVEESLDRINTMDERLRVHRASAIKMGSVHFACHAIIMAAITNSPTLQCIHQWIPTSLCAIAGTVNLLALIYMGCQYIQMLGEQDKNRRLHHNLTHQQRRETNIGVGTIIFRWVVLVILALPFVAFTIITPVGYCHILCAHNRSTSPPAT